MKIRISPALPLAMPIKQPARQEDRCGECLSLFLLEIVVSWCLVRRASKNAIVVEAWRVPQMVMPELVRRCVTLLIKRPLRSYKDARARLTIIGAEQTIESSEHERDAEPCDRVINVNATNIAHDPSLDAKVALKPRGFQRCLADRTGIIGHHCSPDVARALRNSAKRPSSSRSLTESLAAWRARSATSAGSEADASSSPVK